MDKNKFVNQLKVTAETLKPLTEKMVPGQLIWNGTGYAKSTESQQLEPYALAWWSILINIAELIDSQESPISDRQIKYLEHLLFGGMGSLNDLSFDPELYGDLARSVNNQLDNQRRALYASFNA